MLARRFLWIIAILIMIVIAAAFAYSLFGERLITAAMVPSAEFKAPPAKDAPDYSQLAAWAAHPAKPRDAAHWTPAGYTAPPRPGVSVFYVLPTSIFDRTRWNAAMDDAKVGQTMDLFLQSQASVFNGVAEIWAPRYRQATFGAFLTDKPEAKQALDLAYRDVLAAFDAFIAAQPAGRPIILAGHSQGSLLLMRLLKDRVAGTGIAARIVAVYIPGWPISVTADLPALGLPACSTPDQNGCILSWQSYARPADYGAIRARFDAGTGLTGARRLGTGILCVNPMTGMASDEKVPAKANLGSLVPNADFSGGSLVPHGIGAQCLPAGILDIGEPPNGFGSYVLPGNNYHVYDYPLFWANLRADVERRVDGYAAPVAPVRKPVKHMAAA